MSDLGPPPEIPAHPGAPEPRPCASCGWPNALPAETCSFCRAPLRKAATRGAPRPRPVTCPLCEATTLRATPSDTACPECGHDGKTAPTAAARAAWRARNAASTHRVPGWAWAVLLLVLPTLVSMTVFLRSQAKAMTADHVRQLRKYVEIYAVEQGGFPGELSALERRYGPPPAYLLKDGWGRSIAYTARRPFPEPFEDGTTRFAECEIRSAGPNGTPGDEDDVVWTGKEPG